MAKNNKGSKARASTTSVSERRAVLAVEAVAPAFAAWCNNMPGLPEGALEDLIDAVGVLASAYFKLVPAADVTSFEPLAFGQAMTAVASVEAEQDTEFIFVAIRTYLQFLEETKGWTGSQEDLAQVFTLFYDDDDEPDEPGELELPQHPSADEELAALSGTQLAAHLRSLLQWIGESKPVTSTGALKLAEIEGAAAAVGLVAKGAARNAKRQHIPGFNTESLEPSAPLIVKTMHDLPLLSKIWAALEGGGFIDIGSTKVWPTPNAEAILNHGHPAHLAALRGLMANFLSVSVMGEQEWAPWVAPAAEAQAGLLYAAALAGSTIPVVLLENPDTLESLGMDEFAGRLLRRRMVELEELGVVTLDGAVRVQPALATMVLLALGRQVGDGGGAGPRLPGSVNAGLGLAPTHPVPLLQLKVAIEDTKPPVWRRLVLRSDLTLAQMHSIIQTSFEWFDCHLHEFNVGGYNGITYGPVGPEHDFGDPMPHDESAVTLGQLLKAEKEHISYTYDFGDNWRHRITLEKILPFAPGPAVRCAGGRGMGPAEDSGGTWGWQNVVTAVNDPAHQEHAEYRDWLGMGQGEALDPKEFDRAALDEELTELF